MNYKKWSGLLLSLVAGLALLGAGCGRGSGKDTKDDKQQAQNTPPPEDKGWWCEEHGVAESDCTMCHPNLIKQFKKNKDWCEKHNRAQSICFICEPKLQEKWAQVYRTKENKDPPPIPEKFREEVFGPK